VPVETNGARMPGTGGWDDFVVSSKGHADSRQGVWMPSLGSACGRVVDMAWHTWLMEWRCCRLQ